MRRPLFALVSLALSSCVPMRSVVDFSAVDVSPPTLMVSQKIARPLVIVINPAQLPNDIVVKNSDGKAKGTGMQSFLSNGITKVMVPYFETVRVVRSGDPVLKQPHFIAHTQLQGVEYRDSQIGNLRYRRLRMQWSFAIKASEGGEYVFSYAGEGISADTYRTPEEGGDQMLTSALNHMMEKWTESKVASALKAIDAPAPAVRPAPATPEGI